MQDSEILQLLTKLKENLVSGSCLSFEKEIIRIIDTA